MAEHNFDLHNEEQVMFERPHVVVTNRRLLVVKGMVKTKADAEVSLSDVGIPKKLNGGQKDRLADGAKLFVGGSAVIFLEVVMEQFADINDSIETVFFVLGALAAVVGVYFLLGSFLGVKPNTLMVFPMADGEEIVVRFPEWDNPEADELNRQFSRAKRAI